MIQFTNFIRNIPGGLDSAFTTAVQQRFGNMHGFEWVVADNGSDTVGWRWTVADTTDTHETDNELYEYYIQYMTETSTRDTCIAASRHAPGRAWSRVWRHYLVLTFR
jgi:hypothetical protein